MQRIDDPSNVPAKPAPLATVSPGYFRRPSVLAGDQGTIVTADFLNDVQETIIHPILVSGNTLAKGAANRLTLAIATLANASVSTHNAIASSEGVAAHARFATAADVLEQALGSVAISPLRLKQAFPASLANPGYFQLPTLAGNMIFNFGSQSVSANTTVTVNLPRPYATGAVIRLATLDIRTNPGSGGAVSCWDNVANPLTQIDIRNGSGNGQPLSWLSLGI